MPTYRSAINPSASTTRCGKIFSDACTASYNILIETDLDITVASTNCLKPRQFDELRKLWVHGVHADTNAVGWLPTSVFDSRARTNEVTAVYRDHELVGWCLRGRSHARQVLKIYQIWVRPDARILEHGRALIDDLAKIALGQKCWCLEAWVAEDLAANIFWNAIGFERGVWRWGRGKSLRKIYRWTILTGAMGGGNSTLGEFKGVEYYDNRNR